MGKQRENRRRRRLTVIKTFRLSSAEVGLLDLLTERRDASESELLRALLREEGERRGIDMEALRAA